MNISKQVGNQAHLPGVENKIRYEYEYDTEGKKKNGIKYEKILVIHEQKCYHYLG